jgi:electron transfer flavoprotein beta subunit
VGLAGAGTEVVDFTERPPRQAGVIVKDEGDGGVKIAEFLAAQKFI